VKNTRIPIVGTPQRIAAARQLHIADVAREATLFDPHNIGNV
jgi:hypothetical protein